MDAIPIHSRRFWDDVGEHVASKVIPALGRSPRSRKPVIVYLRDLETIARRECDSREAIQIIASGRRVLGDRTVITSGDAPYLRT